MSTQVALDEWLTAMNDAMAEVCTTVLGYDGSSLGDVRSDNPELTGAYIALVGEHSAVQLAVAASDETCAQLAACLLGMEPEEAAELSEADVADGIGELMNVVAGGVKTRLAHRDRGIQLGLPFVVQGRIERASATAILCRDAALGEHPVCMLVIGDARVSLAAA